MAPQTLLLAFLSVVVAAVEGTVVPPNTKIEGGAEIDISKAPWMVAFIAEGWHKCGGAIISKDWALTAAHCTHMRDIYWGGRSNSEQHRVDEGLPSADSSEVGAVGVRPRFTYDLSQILLRVGSNAKSSGGQEYRVSKIVNHPKFVYGGYTNDISLLKTSRPINLDGAKTATVNLPPRGAVLPNSPTVTVAGWGYRGGRHESPTLKAAENKVHPFRECYSEYPNENLDEATQFCVGWKDGRSCGGDSGGPATVADVVVGVVCGGKSCNYSGLRFYTRVTSYRDWINTVTGL